jgi:polyphosphate kinase
VFASPPELKVHAKMALIVRNERGQLRRYAHLSSGNYNAFTARGYTDIGLLTCDEDITADVTELFESYALRRRTIAFLSDLDRRASVDA